MTQADPQKKYLFLKYEFKFEKGQGKTFELRLDEESLELSEETGHQGFPDWAKMEKFRCENCPLDGNKHEFCPLAVNLFHLVENFKNEISCDEVEVRIESPRRSYLKRTSIQQALSSLIGIYMVTSGCPVFDNLKPMVRYHLPFANNQETAYRMISMYLMAQFFRQKQGKDADWELKKIPQLFDDIRKVNRNVCKNFRALVEKDALLNAVIILNSNVDFMAICFDEVILKDIERDFKPLC